MKKYKTLIFSLLVLIISIWCRYYNDQIIDKFFVFILLPYLLLLLGYIKLWINCIAKIGNEKNLINIITLCILVINGVMILFFPFRDFKTNLELKLYEEDRNEIIDLVKNNVLITDEYGNAKLSKNQKKLSTSGEIKIYKNDVEGQVISFWILRGIIGSDSIQLVYSSSDYNLIEENLDNDSIIEIKKLKENWFYVITEY